MNYKLARETHKEIKKYNRQEMQDFLTRLYLNGYTDGQKTTQEQGITEDRLLEILKQTKGVGPKLQGAIMEGVRGE